MVINKHIIRTFFTLISILIIGQSSGQEFQKIKVPKLKKSYYLTTGDSGIIDLELVKKVTTKFGFSEFRETEYSKMYKKINGISGTHFASFSKYPYITNIDTKFRLEGEVIDMTANEPIYLYGFTSNINEGNRVNKNYSKLLVSAYLQEFDNNYLNTPSNFSSLVHKDRSEFWKRNWINMGYGMSYLTKDNPFMGNKALAVGFFYVLEALHYIPIFGGSFIGETQNDKIVIPIVGISSLLVWKSVFSGLIIGNRQLKINQSINNSGYKIPGNLKY